MSNQTYQMETADQALSRILRDMESGQASSIDILAEPKIDPNTVPVIRDADELDNGYVVGFAADDTEEDLPFIDEADLEEIADEEDTVPMQTYDVPVGAHTPRTAMVVLPKEDSGVAQEVGKTLEQQGMQVEYQQWDIGAISYMGKKTVDVLVLGQDFNNVASYVEQSSTRKGTFTVAVTEDTRSSADVRVKCNEQLEDYVKSGRVVTDYANNDDAQQWRREIDNLLSRVEAEGRK